MAEHSANIGQRLRQLRRWRGLTLAELGGLAGVTPSQLSMWETGRRPLDRRSHIAALAAALKVSEAELTGGPHLSTDPQQSGPHAVIPALREALQVNSLTGPAVDHGRPLAELATLTTGRASRAHEECDYITAGSLLPAILDEVYWHAASARGDHARDQALNVLIEACLSAGLTAKDLGYVDLAYVAALRAQEAARLIGDPVAQGKADVLRLWAFPRERSWARRLATAEQAADALEPHAAAPLGVQVLGMLTLHASLAAAVLQHQPAVTHWLDEAGKLAARIPDDPVTNWKSFCQTNVSLWRIAAAVERGESGGTVLKLASDVRQDKLTVANRRAMFFSDVGRGLAREPRMRDQAVRWLRRAEDAAPQLIRNNAPTRETVIYLRDRALSSTARELRGMAARMGIPG